MMMVVAVVFVAEVPSVLDRSGCVGGCEKQHFTGGAQRAACNSFRRPHAAQICNNVGLVLADSLFERSVATSTAQRVSGR